MPLKFYLDYVSQPTRALGIFLKVNNIPFEAKVLSLLKGEHKTKEYAKINYFQAVPCIDDDGFILTEGVAIFKYLVATRKVPDHWYPQDPKARARVDQFLAWQHTGLRKGDLDVFVAIIHGPLEEGKPLNYDALKDKVVYLEKVLDQMESFFLKDRPYVAGRQISIADILAICEVIQIAAFNYDVRKSRPKLSAWMDRVTAQLQPHFDDITKTIYDIAAKFTDRVDFSKVKV